MSPSVKKHSRGNLTLLIRYRFIADCPKLHNLLTLVDRLDFICKRKGKSISVTKNKKKYEKKIFSMVYRELFIQENHSQWLTSGTKYGRIVADEWVSRWVDLFADRLLNIYRLSIEFF